MEGHRPIVKSVMTVKDTKGAAIEEEVHVLDSAGVEMGLTRKVPLGKDAGAGMSKEQFMEIVKESTGQNAAVTSGTIRSTNYARKPKVLKVADGHVTRGNHGNARISVVRKGSDKHQTLPKEQLMQLMDQSGTLINEGDGIFKVRIPVKQGSERGQIASHEQVMQLLKQSGSTIQEDGGVIKVRMGQGQQDQAEYLRRIMDPFNLQEQEEQTAEITSSDGTVKSVDLISLDREELFDKFGETDHYPLEELKEIFEDKAVKQVDLSGVEVLTDAFFYWLQPTDSLKYLRKVVVQGCLQLTDDTFRCLAPQHVTDQPCPKLASVNANGCSALTERSLSALLTHPNVTSIQMSACNVAVIPKPQAGRIKTMNLVGCPLISPSTKTLGDLTRITTNKTCLQNLSTDVTSKVLKVVVVPHINISQPAVNLAKTLVTGELQYTDHRTGLYGRVGHVLEKDLTLNIFECHDTLLDLMMTDRTLFVISYTCNSSGTSLASHVLYIKRRFPEAVLVIVGVTHKKGSGSYSLHDMYHNSLKSTVTEKQKLYIANDLKVRKNAKSMDFIRQKTLNSISNLLAMTADVDKFMSDIIFVEENVTMDKGLDNLKKVLYEAGQKVIASDLVYGALSKEVTSLFTALKNESFVQAESDVVAALMKKQPGLGPEPVKYHRALTLMQIFGYVVYIPAEGSQNSCQSLDAGRVITDIDWFSGVIQKIFETMKPASDVSSDIVMVSPSAKVISPSLLSDALNQSNKNQIADTTKLLFDIGLLLEEGQTKNLVVLSTLTTSTPITEGHYTGNNSYNSGHLVEVGFSTPGDPIPQFLHTSILSKMCRLHPPDMINSGRIDVQHSPVMTTAKVYSSSFGAYLAVMTSMPIKYNNPDGKLISPGYQKWREDVACLLETMLAQYRSILAHCLLKYNIYFEISTKAIYNIGRSFAIEDNYGITCGHDPTNDDQKYGHCRTCLFGVDLLQNLWREYRCIRPSLSERSVTVDGEMIQQSTSLIQTSASDTSGRVVSTLYPLSCCTFSQWSCTVLTGDLRSLGLRCWNTDPDACPTTTSRTAEQTNTAKSLLVLNIKPGGEISVLQEKSDYDTSSKPETTIKKTIPGGATVVFRAVAMPDSEDVKKDRFRVKYTIEVGGEVLGSAWSPFSEKWMPFVEMNKSTQLVVNNALAQPLPLPHVKDWPIGALLEVTSIDKTTRVAYIASYSRGSNQITLRFAVGKQNTEPKVPSTSLTIHPLGYTEYKTVPENRKDLGEEFDYNAILKSKKGFPVPHHYFTRKQTEGCPPYVVADETVQFLQENNIPEPSLQFTKCTTQKNQIPVVQAKIKKYLDSAAAPSLRDLPIILLPLKLDHKLIQFPNMKCWQGVNTNHQAHLVCNHHGANMHVIDTEGVVYPPKLYIKPDEPQADDAAPGTNEATKEAEAEKQVLPSVQLKLSNDDDLIVLTALKMKSVLVLYKCMENKNFLPDNVQYLLKDVDSLSHHKLEEKMSRLLEMLVYPNAFFMPYFDAIYKAHPDPKKMKEYISDVRKTLVTRPEFRGLLDLEGMPQCEVHQQFGQTMSQTKQGIPEGMFERDNHLISHLALPNRNIDTLPANLFQLFPNLEEVDLSGNNLTDLPEGLAHCPKVTVINVSANKLNFLPADFISCKDRLVSLDISQNPFKNIPDIVYRFTSLQELQANHILLKELSPKLKELKSLEFLSLDGNMLRSLHPDIIKLDKLRQLNLSGVPWIENHDRGAILSTEGLTTFIAKYPLLNEKRADILELFTGCSGGQGTLDLPGIQNFNSRLYAMFPRLEGKPEEIQTYGGVPSQIFKMKKLCVLTFMYQGLTKVTDHFKVMDSLEELLLSNNPKLESISAELSTLKKLRSLSLRTCPSLKTPPREIVARGFKAIHGYLKRLNMGSVECKRTKLMMVGLGGAGKTSLVRALKKTNTKPEVQKEKGENFEAEVITDGIDITDWTVSGVTFSMWDFAGQTVYYNTHQFFMSNRAVYLLLWNIRLGYEHAGLDFWLSSIACHAPKAPILVVGTHCDQVEKFWLPTEELKARYPQIKGFHTISCFTNKGIGDLSGDIVTVALKEKYMGEQIPEAWLNLEKMMLSEKDESDGLSWDHVADRAQDCGIVENSEVEEAIQFLHELGSVQHFSNIFLKDRVVINPQWIVDAMACVVSVHDTPIQEGRLFHTDIHKVWKDFDPDVHKWLLRLTEEFDLTFPLRDQEANVVPCLLPAEEPEYSWPEVSPATGIKETTMSYSFDYLPAGLFNRAQVRLYQYSDSSTIWKKGSLLKKNGHLALLKQKHNKVELKVQGPRPENVVFMVHEVFEGLLLESFHGVAYDYYVPCSDCVKAISPDPSLFPASKIRLATELKVPFLQCEKRFHALSLHELHSAMPPDNSTDYDIHLERSLRDLDNLKDDLCHDVIMIYNAKDVPGRGEDDKKVHPRRMVQDLEDNGYRVWFPSDPKKIDLQKETLTFREAKLVVICVSNDFVADPVSCRIFMYIKQNLQKDVQLVTLGKGLEWKQSAVGMHCSTSVYVNMSDPKRYSHKIKELLGAVNDVIFKKTQINQKDPPQCFISYCWSNSADAVKKGTKATATSVGYGDPRQFKEYLESEGIPCWLDVQNLGKGSLFEGIAQGLRHAKVMLVCISDEYCTSRNCLLEFRFASISLKIPMVVAVVGKGFKWVNTEVGMLTVDVPKVNLQLESDDGMSLLLEAIKSKLPKEAPKEKKTEPSNSKSDENKPSEKKMAFQELLELAQRKFLRQVGLYADSMETVPYPHLFLMDYMQEEDMQRYLLAQKHQSQQADDKESGEKVEPKEGSDDEEDDIPPRPTTAGRNRPVSAMSRRARQIQKRTSTVTTTATEALSIDDMPEFCIRYLCEHDGGWHDTKLALPLPDIDSSQWEELLADIAPYMARIYAIMKHTSVSLPVLNTAKGDSLRKKLIDKCSLDSEYRSEYVHWRKTVMETDMKSLKCMGNLARCHLPSGKILWLCPEHQKQDRVTILSNDATDVGPDAGYEDSLTAPVILTAGTTSQDLKKNSSPKKEIQPSKLSPTPKPQSSPAKISSPKPEAKNTPSSKNQDEDRKTKPSKTCVLM